MLTISLITQATVIPEIFDLINFRLKNFGASNFRRYYNRQKFIMLPLQGVVTSILPVETLMTGIKI